MSDLRKTSVASDDANTTAADVSAALSQDFNDVRAKSANTNVVEDNKVDEAASDDAFVITERVLTVDVVKRLAVKASSKRWSVQKNAVVTPAAKDELRKLGAQLVVTRSHSAVSVPNAAARSSRVTFSASNATYGDYVGARTQNAAAQEFKAESGAKDVKAARVLIATHLPDAEDFPRSAKEYLTRNAETTEIRLSCLKETSKRIVEEIAADKSLKVVLATHDAAIGSIWANRLSGVRAVVAYTFEQSKRDITAANANVLIVDPRDVGPYPLRRIVDYFLR